MNVTAAFCRGCGMNGSGMDQPSIPTQGGGLIPSMDCNRLCMEILAREYSDPAYFAVHRLTVATYASQHPDSVKPHSAAVHLVVLCLAIERGLPQHVIRQHLRRASAGLRARPPERLAPPEQRGSMTVADIAGSRNASEHCARVHRWASEVWSAWQPEHERVRSWLATAQ